MPFDVVVAKQPAKCQNCKGIIPKGQKKLRFRELAGQYSISKSGCRNCGKELLEELIREEVSA